MYISSLYKDYKADTLTVSYDSLIVKRVKLMRGWRGELSLEFSVLSLFSSTISLTLSLFLSLSFLVSFILVFSPTIFLFFIFLFFFLSLSFCAFFFFFFCLLGQGSKMWKSPLFWSHELLNYFIDPIKASLISRLIIFNIRIR